MNDILDFEEEKAPKNNSSYHSSEAYASLKITVTLIFSIFIAHTVAEAGIEKMLLTTLYLLVIVVNAYGVIHGIQSMLHKEIDVRKKWNPFIANINMFIINLFVLYVIMS